MEPRKPSLGAIFLTIVARPPRLRARRSRSSPRSRATRSTSTARSSATLLGVELLADAVPLRAHVGTPLGSRRPQARAHVVHRGDGAREPRARPRARVRARASRWLFVARIFAGIATANLGTASAYIADVTSPKDRAKGMGLIGVAFGVGFILGPGFGGVLAQAPAQRSSRTVGAARRGRCSARSTSLGAASASSSRSRRRSASSAKAGAARSPIDVRTTLDVLADPAIARAVLANFVLILVFSRNLEQTYRFFNKDAFGMSLARDRLPPRRRRRRRRGGPGRHRPAPLRQGGGRDHAPRRTSSSRSSRSRSRACHPTSDTGCSTRPAWSSRSATASRSPRVSAYVSKRAPATSKARRSACEPVDVEPRARLRSRAREASLYGSRSGMRSPYWAAATGMSLALLIALTLPTKTPEPPATPVE